MATKKLTKKEEAEKQARLEKRKASREQHKQNVESLKADHPELWTTFTALRQQIAACNGDAKVVATTLKKVLSASVRKRRPADPEKLAERRDKLNQQIAEVEAQIAAIQQ